MEHGTMVDQKENKEQKNRKKMFNKKAICWRLEVAGDAKDARLPEMEVPLAS